MTVRSMRSLRTDKHGDETLMPVFIFCATFIVIGAFVIGLMGPLFASADRGDFTLMQNYETVGGISYLLYDPNDGYNITSANVTSTERSDSPLTFTNSTVSDRLVYVFRDYDGELADDVEGEPLDFFEVWTEWGPWYNHHVASIIIDYKTVEENQIVGTNQSSTPFSIRGTNEVLVITTPGNESEFETMLWANICTVQMGQPAFPTDMASSSMWTILTQLMTASLPNVHPIINYMITIPFWACMGFMVFTIISRMIPFISGG